MSHYFTEKAEAELAALNKKTAYDLYLTAMVVVLVAFVTVLVLATFFYYRSKMVCLNSIERLGRIFVG
jgi:hypothetical protein